MALLESVVTRRALITLMIVASIMEVNQTGELLPGPEPARCHLRERTAQTFPSREVLLFGY